MNSVTEIPVIFSLADLPNDVRLEIFDHLDIPSLLTLSRVSKEQNKGTTKKIILIHARECVNAIPDDWNLRKIEALLKIAKVDLVAAPKINRSIIEIAFKAENLVSYALQALASALEKEIILKRILEQALNMPNDSQKFTLLIEIAFFQLKENSGNFLKTFEFACGMVEDVPRIVDKIVTYLHMSLFAYQSMGLEKANFFLERARDLAHEDKEAVHFLNFLKVLPWYTQLIKNLPDCDKEEFRKFDKSNLDEALLRINEIEDSKLKLEHLLDIAKWHFYFGKQLDFEKVMSSILQMIDTIPIPSERFDFLHMLCSFQIEIEDIEGTAETIKKAEETLPLIRKKAERCQRQEVLIASKVNSGLKLDIIETFDCFHQFKDAYNFESRKNALITTFIKLKCRDGEFELVEDLVKKLENKNWAVRDWIKALMKVKQIDKALEVFYKFYTPGDYDPFAQVSTDFVVALAKNNKQGEALKIIKLIPKMDRVRALVKISKFF